MLSTILPSNFSATASMVPKLQSDLSLVTRVFDLAILDGPDVVTRPQRMRPVLCCDVNMVCMLYCSICLTASPAPL
jgi:hypothetical protein